MKQIITFLLICISFISCKREKEVAPTSPKKKPLTQVVLITKNAPGKYAHLIKQDSLGKQTQDSIGPKLLLPNYGFSYLNTQNTVETWIPKSHKIDTLVIPCYFPYLELMAYNPFTASKESFLVKQGDTIVFNYEHNLPVATLKNRKVNDIELNYNKFRFKKLFNNKYSSYRMVFLNIFLEGTDNIKDQTLNYYFKAQKDYQKEMQLLDSLYDHQVISITNYHYRQDALKSVMEDHKNYQDIKNWLKSKNPEELATSVYYYNLAKTDSLMEFSFFRDYLNSISAYNLPFITENNGNSGGSYIDSRIRFDSILADKRFNQTARNFLLFETYEGIITDFKAKDKEKYYHKLVKSTTNIQQLQKLKNKFHLNFSNSDHLVLTSINKDTISFQRLVEKNRGKWLYIDFWASWCRPCRGAFPFSKNLERLLKGKNINFIYLALNDNKENWIKAIKTDSLNSGNNYFIENGNTTKVIDELVIKTIPHYLIYNPKGELINGNALRPGRGAKVQLLDYLKTTSN